MNKAIRILLVLLLVVLGTANTIGLAAANEETSANYSNPDDILILLEKLGNAADQEKYYNELSPKTQKAVVEALTPAYSKISKIEEVVDRGSKIVSFGHVVYNNYDQAMFMYEQSVHWAYDGTYITSIISWEWDDTTYFPFFLLWHFTGEDTSTMGGVGYFYFNAHNEGHWVCYIGIDPIMWCDVTLNTNVYGDGSYNYNSNHSMWS